MNSNSLNVNFYWSNIRDEERDEEQCWSRFFHFDSVFVEIQRSAGAALKRVECQLLRKGNNYVIKICD